MSYIIEATNVSKRYANHLALDRVNIKVKDGSIFGLLGPNGAGKTTFIRIINNINAPDEGEVRFNNKLLNSEHTSLIGYLPEERGLYKKMKVGEQALYLSRLKGLSRTDALKKLKYWFEKFEIQNWWNRKVEELSKGMQQKVQFIVTVLHEPKLLIFDEPFTGFDPINVNILKDEIFRLKEKGSTVIFSTHNMASVEELCDEIALINKSRKILDGNVKEIKQTYKSNIYEILIDKPSLDIEAIFNGNFKIIDKEDRDNLLNLKVKILDNPPNTLLQLLLPHTQIHSFIEILPTMNDIFINKVELDN